MNALLDDVGGFLADLCAAAPSAQQSGEDAPAPAHVDVALGASWRAYAGLRERCSDAELSLAVVALAKSGEAGGLRAEGRRKAAKRIRPASRRRPEAQFRALRAPPQPARHAVERCSVRKGRARWPRARWPRSAAASRVTAAAASNAP